MILNDEEFKHIKALHDTHKLTINNEGLNRLIKTIDSLKKKYNNAHSCAVQAEKEKDNILEMYHPQDIDHKILKLKEENARLKFELAAK